MPVPMQKCRSDSTKVFCSRANKYAQEKVREIQILSNNENNTLINNLIDQTKLLENVLRSKDTVI